MEWIYVVQILVAVLKDDYSLLTQLAINISGEQDDLAVHLE